MQRAPSDASPVQSEANDEIWGSRANTVTGCQTVAPTSVVADHVADRPGGGE